MWQCCVSDRERERERERDSEFRGQCKSAVYLLLISIVLWTLSLSPYSMCLKIKTFQNSLVHEVSESTIIRNETHRLSSALYLPMFFEWGFEWINFRLDDIQ